MGTVTFDPLAKKKLSGLLCVHLDFHAHEQTGCRSEGSLGLRSCAPSQPGPRRSAAELVHLPPLTAPELGGNREHSRLPAPFLRATSKDPHPDFKKASERAPAAPPSSPGVGQLPVPVLFLELSMCIQAATERLWIAPVTSSSQRKDPRPEGRSPFPFAKPHLGSDLTPCLLPAGKSWHLSCPGRVSLSDPTDILIIQ